MNSPSDADIRNHFEQYGFVVIPKALTAVKIGEIFSDIDRLLGEALAHACPDRAAAGTLDEKYRALKKHSPHLKSHAYDLIKYLDSLHLAARTGPVMEAVRMLTSGPLLIDRVQVRIDDESNDRVLPMHQEVYGQISWDCINVWMPLVNVTPNTGSLRLAPGSHKRGHLKHRFFPDFNNAHGLCDDQINERDIISPDFSAGDAVIFHPFLVHGSGATSGNDIRWTLVARYNPVRRIPYLENAECPVYIEQTDVTTH